MEKEELKAKIVSANASYRSGNPVIGDQEYDDLLEEYGKLVSEEEFSNFKDTLNEGTIEKSKGIKHKYIAGSLDKLKYEEPDDVRKYVSKYIKNALVVSAKIDGLSGIAKYSNGRLETFATRGDGYTGQNITDKSMFVKFLPKTINETGDVYVRGELVILKYDYGNVEGSATRNIVAGLINRKEWNEHDMANVSFVAYTVLGEAYTKEEQLDFLEKNGFKTAWHVKIPVSEISTEDIVEKLFGYATQDFEYLTDGLVLSDSEYRNEERYRPMSSMAFKLNQNSVETRLIDVVFQGPSKNGFFSPVGILDPVDVDGVIVSKCTLHNLDFIKEKGVKIGDRIKLIRSGEVIPKLLSVVSTSPESVDVNLPDTCPSCGSTLVVDGVNLRCSNSECSDQKIYQVMHFIKKMDVDNASFKTLKKFGICSFSSLVGFKPNKSYKSETKLYGEFSEKIFNQSKRRIFSCMNFNGLSETLLNKIIDHYGWDLVSSYFSKGDVSGKMVCSKDISKICNDGSNLPSGIGQIMFDKFVDGLVNTDVVNDFNLVVSDPRYRYVEQENMNAKKKDAGISCCFTGALRTMSRNEASILAQNAGWAVKSGVSKGLTYLVTNDTSSGSSKNKKASELGTKIINEDEFLRMVNCEAGDIDDL